MNIDTAASVKTANQDLLALKSNPVGKVKELIATPDRPLAISILAWLGAIGVVLGVVGVVGALGLGAVFAAVLGIVFVLLGAVSCLGFFGMRKWAVHLYVVTTVLNQVMLLAYGAFGITGLILPAIILAICVKYYPKMT